MTGAQIGPHAFTATDVARTLRIAAALFDAAVTFGERALRSS